MCVLNSSGKTAVWQVELLSAHLMQTVDLVSMTVSSILQCFKTTFALGFHSQLFYSAAKSEHFIL